MSSKRVFYVMVGLLVLLGVSLVGVAYATNTVLQERSDKLVTLKARNATIGVEQTELNKAKKDIETYRDLNAIAKAIVPQDKDQAEAVREIVNIAAAQGIRLSSITFAASTLGGPSGTKKTPLTQVQAVPNIPGVYQLPITVQQDTGQPITYKQFIDFLTALENNRRTAQVSNITIKPTSDRNKLSFTLQLNEYIKP